MLNNALVWDNHGCMPLRPGDFAFLPQLQRYADNGVDVVSLNVGFDTVPFVQTFQVLADFRRWLQDQDDFVLVHTVEEIESAVGAGKLAVTFDIEGAACIADQVSLVSMFYDLGVRWMLMAYNQNNLVGGGCQDDDSGLTAYGREVLAEMKRVGMVACCSHTGERTTMDVMAHADNPVIFSHSNPLGMWQHERNISDQAIDACAQTGGVICLNGIGIFLGDNDASSATFVNHVDYVLERVGDDHVGIGLDYVFDPQELDDYINDHPDVFPPEKGYAAGIDMVGPEQVPEILGIFKDRGYSESTINKILGQNLMRVAREVWAT